MAAHDLQKLVARQNKLADERHQVFEDADVDAKRLRLTVPSIVLVVANLGLLR
ncbi:MAG: hypothetical protein RID59_11525 [Hoeflea sp.]